MENFIPTIANSGTRYKLNLIDNVQDFNGKLVSQTKPKVLNKVDMSKETRDLVMKGMRDVTGEGGTAQFNPLTQDKIDR